MITLDPRHLIEALCVCEVVSVLSNSSLLQGSEPCGSSVVKSPPAMQETLEMRVQSLGGEDPVEVGMATHSSILAWRIPMDRGT